MLRQTCLSFAAMSLAVGIAAQGGCAAPPTKTAAAAPRPKAAASTPQKPNVIFVLADDMGYADLACYGGKGVKSTNIDRLASEGIRFTQFYVNSPICSPSRTAFTTGQYPARWNITSYIDNRAANRNRGMAQWLDLKAPTLARSLSGAGYLTGHFGKWHMGGGRDVGEAPLPTQYGFSESLTQFEGLGDRVLPYLEGEGGQQQRMGLGEASEKLGRGKVTWQARSKVTGTFVNRALDFIKKADQQNKPFYVNLWPDDVHSPFDPPRDLRGNGNKRSLYRGVLTNMDAQLGPLFDAIRSNPKLRANTLIIFASDNGPEPGAGLAGTFRGSKGNIYEGGIREPLIVWGPGLLAKNKQGTVNKTAVLSAVDVSASIRALAGIQGAAPKADGTNVSDTLTGKKATGRTQPLFWKRPPDREGDADNVLPDLAVRDGNWKLLCGEDGGRVQLYNLTTDESETKNVAASNAPIVNRLKPLVLAWNKTLPVVRVAQPKLATANTFTLQTGQHLNREQAPAIAGKGFSVKASFNSKTATGEAARGVLVAQGGVANGYSLLIDENGQLVFFVRRNKGAFTVKTPVPGSGPHTALATLKPDGALTLSLDDQPAASGKAPGLFIGQPLDGLDVGSDDGGLVGDYQDANRFTGTIQQVTIELAPAK